MNPGRLREVITVQEKVSDGGGAHNDPSRDERWADAFDARSTPPKVDNQRTDIIGGKDEPRQRAVFTVRAQDGYTTDRRIVWEGDAYFIEAARPKDIRGRYLEVSTVWSGEVDE